ncbi:MAG: tetratricopeptide repeat protein, partial [Myxococcales bacterium]|nr:tetratricopeptide repeat protein [Myxococcales bacterium]
PAVATPEPSATPAAAPAPVLGKRTTDPALAVSNLAAQVEGARQAYAARPDQLPFGKRLIDLELVQAQLLGMTSRYDDMLRVADELVARAPDDARAYLLRAHVRSALHRFADARADLGTAREKGADADVVEARLASAAMAAGEGDLEAMLRAADARVAIHHDYELLADRASILMTMGRYDDADAAFAAAAESYHDVSPMALAWVDFQRGMMWAERANRPERARPFYEAAIARFPRYVVANVHLAELYAEGGERDRAIALLEPVAAVAEDPEPKALLGELLVARGGADAERGHALVAAARAGYDALLAAHPEAFADHGAEFFAGPGEDLPRARELAAKNLALRPTPRAYGLAVRLAVQAGDHEQACALADAARRGRSTPNLEATLGTVGSCAPR